MDIKDKQRAVIEFLSLEGCANEENARRLGNVYGGDADSLVMVFR
jgi:hypothetical protein